jgi:prolyl oligopeptidase
MRLSAGPALALFLVVPSYGQLSYPPTRTVDASDTYFGTNYRDPYRWLENLRDNDVRAWFKAQAELTDGVLAGIPGRDALLEEWLGLDRLSPATYRSISYENGRVFYKKTLGGENVGKLFFREGWDGAERLLFDPAKYRPGVTTNVQSVAPSFDGRFVALGLNSGGAGFSEIRVLDVGHGTLLPESIYPSLGPEGWTPDSKSFFYDSGDVADIKSLGINLNRKTRLHMLGSEVAWDIDFFSSERYPELGIAPSELPEVRIDESCPGYVFERLVTMRSEIRVFYAPVPGMNSATAKWDSLCQPSDNLVQRLVFHGDYVYAESHADAPRYKVVRTSVKHPDWKHAETVVPQGQDPIEHITGSRDFLFVVYSDGIRGRIVRVDYATGNSAEINLPTSGIVGVSCPDSHSNRCIVSLTSWISPTVTYDLDAGTGAFAKSTFNTDVSYPGFDNLAVDEVEVPANDGAMVPLSIIHAKGIPLDGSNSCILEGYGAYGSSMSPSFSVRQSIALRGVVLAFAHTRGGGEKGEAWHKAGFKATKPNTWNDFISCAEYLVSKGYTSPGKLAGLGGSAGGILISRAITQRPDLFAAAVCEVGDANAMRLEFRPMGPFSIPEFGTVKDPVECRALYEMDGVQHVLRGVKYPAVLCVGGWNDDRVPAWQPGKFAAALQNATASGKPVLMKVNYDSGHGTEEKFVMFKDLAGQYAFLLWQTGHRDFQPAD